MKLYIAVLCITRHYLGPWEGGTWGNACELYYVEPIKRRNGRKLRKGVKEARKRMKTRYPDVGDIYSMKGGEEYRFVPVRSMAEALSHQYFPSRSYE
jgi:hypothetical protein